MAIEIDYGSSYVRSNGLKDYLALYELTFEQPSHPSSEQGFSTVDGSGYSAVVGGVTQNYSATFSDWQYAGQTTGLDENDTPYVSAFIAQADAGGDIGKLVYSLFNLPTHTLFGDLDSVALGETLSKNYPDPVNKPTEFFYELGTTHVTVSNLMSVLNEGVTGDPSVPIDWRTGSSPYDPYDISNNDVHNVIYPLMAGHGGNGSTSGLQHYFDLNGVQYNGTAADEYFDGFDAEDVFKVGGYSVSGDVIDGFDASEDVIDFRGYSHGFVDAADVLNYYSSGEINNGDSLVTLTNLSGTLTASNFLV